jgi:hypothetical protein
MNQINRYYVSLKNRDKTLNPLFEIFDISVDLRKQIETPDYSSNIETIIYNNPYSNLYKYITYFLFYNSKSRFDTGKIDNSAVKEQTGKDLHRLNIKVNNIDINREEMGSFEATDQFNKTLMDIMFKQRIEIELNTVNIIDFLINQQNMQFLVDNFLDASVKNKKDVTIIAKTTTQYFDIFLERGNKQLQLVYSPKLFDGELNECGNIEFKLNMDLSKLTYSLQFQLKYNVFTRNNSENLTNNNNNTNNLTNNSENNNDKPSSFLKENSNSVKAFAGVSGVLATGIGSMLYFGLLGGKTKKNKKKPTKTIKTKRTKRTKTRRTRRKK